MNATVADSSRMRDIIRSPVERYITNAVVGAKAEVELSLEELGVLSSFLQREIYVMDEIVRGELTEDDLETPTRNILHLMSSIMDLPEPSTDGIGKEHETPGFTAYSTVSDPHEECSSEESTVESSQLVSTLRPRHLARGESMAVVMNQLIKSRHSSSASLPSKASSDSLPESINLYFSAARIFERDDVSTEFRNSFTQSKSDHPSVEDDISPLGSFWLASTAASCDYIGDNEQESLEDREKNIQEFLEQLETELLADEQVTKSTPVKSSRLSDHSKEDSFATFIQWTEGSYPLLSLYDGHVKLRPDVTSEFDFLDDGHGLEDAYTDPSDGLESVLAFIGKLEAELHICTSKLQPGEEIDELDVDLDNTHSSHLADLQRVGQHRNLTLDWVQSTSLNPRDQISRSSFSDYSNESVSGSPPGNVSPLLQSENSLFPTSSVDGFDSARDFMRWLEDLEFILASNVHIGRMDLEELIK